MLAGRYCMYCGKKKRDTKVIRHKSQVHCACKECVDSLIASLKPPTRKDEKVSAEQEVLEILAHEFATGGSRGRK
jgi:hypothetical protein